MDLKSIMYICEETKRVNSLKSVSEKDKITCVKAMETILKLHEQGYSTSDIIDILNISSDLTHEKPIAPIGNDDDEWVFTHSVYNFGNVTDIYHNRIYPKLTKSVKSCVDCLTDTITYSDSNRADFVVVNDDCGRWIIDVKTREIIMEHLVDILDRLYPITLPYMPKDSYMFHISLNKNLKQPIGNYYEYGVFMNVVDVITPDGDLKKLELREQII